MNFDEAWDRAHRERPWGKWPDETLVRYVNRVFANDYVRGVHRAAVRVLDLGCGAGANLRMLVEEGFNVEGIDGSEAAISNARLHLSRVISQATVNLQVGDVTALPFEDEIFDLVVDACCLECLDDVTICRALDQVSRVLRPGGRLWSRHSASNGKPTIFAGGARYPRRQSLLSKLYGQRFDCDYYRQVENRAHVHQGTTGRIDVAHWIIEGRKP